MDSDSPAHDIIVASTPEDRQKCYDVRIQVFHHEQKFPLETEIDDNEDIATHFLLRLNDASRTPVGTIRLYQPPGASYWKLSRLAVLKDYRRFRFGRKLVEALHAHLPIAWRQSGGAAAAPRERGAGAVGTAGGDSDSYIEIVAHSQIHAQGFYAKFGYTPEGDQFDEDGDPHQKMVLRMPSSL